MLLLQAADVKLTLTRVATAPVLVAEIAKATGRHLEASPAMRTDVLMVSVDGVATNEVLAKLAIAATASWQPIEGGYRLVPDNAARGIEAIAERARRLQAIQESLKKQQAHAAKEGESTANPIDNPFSNSTVVDSFVPMLDLNALAGMESGDRLVFATGPTAAQRPLLGDASRLMAGWIAQHNENARAMAEGKDNMPEGFAGMMQGPLGDRFKRMSSPVVGKPAKFVVVASRGGVPFIGEMGTGVRLEARVFDAKGAVILEESGSLDADLMGALVRRMTQKPGAPDPKATPIVYSEAAESLANVSGTNMMSSVGIGRPPQPNAALRAILSKPEAFDPLSLVPGEGLAALAKARRRPLVACVPDAAYPVILGSEAPKTVEQLEENLKSGTMRLVPDAAFLLVKPADPATARRVRADRSALAALARETNDHESPTLDEMADFASRTSEPSRNPLSTAYLTMFAPSAMGSMTGLVSWDALRLYAALSPAQRQSLAAGAQVPFTNVAPAGKDALRAMLYGAGGGIEVEGRETPDASDPVSLGMRMAMGGGTDAREEPTEVVPQGLPAGGYLQASVATEPIIRPVAADVAAASVMSLDELAMVRLIKASPMGERMGEQVRLPEGGRLGTRSTWSLRGYVAPGTYVSGSLNDDRTPKDGKRVSLSNLPPDVQARLDQKAEKLKKSPFGAILSMPGGKP